MAVAVLVALSLMAPIASATPGFTLCTSPGCHSQAAVHTTHNVGGAGGVDCANCHVNDAPPTPAACAVCHGAAAIVSGHPVASCTGSGCHEAPAGATITAINPAKAPVNATVSITGTGFGATTGTVDFGTTAATPTSWTATKIVTKVPATLAVGAVDVTVTPSGGSASPAFSFTVTQAVKSSISLRLVGVKSGILRFGRTVTATGIVRPFHAGKVTITFQRRTTKWVTVKKVTRASNATTGLYSFKYKPLRKGSWRVMSKVAKVTIGTNTYSAAQTTWKTFRVR